MTAKTKFILYVFIVYSLAACSLSSVYFDKAKRFTNDGDYQQAMLWYQKSAQLGDPAAMNNIGVLYANGQGVPKNNCIAMEWFRKAAELKFELAKNNLISLESEYKKITNDVPKLCLVADYFVQGGTLEEKKDYQHALEWWNKAADLGSPLAMYQVGFYYLKGWGVPVDLCKSYEWALKAANLSLAMAQSLMAAFYIDGSCVKKNYATAKKWLDLALHNPNADKDANEQAQRFSQSLKTLEIADLEAKPVSIKSIKRHKPVAETKTKKTFYSKPKITELVVTKRPIIKHPTIADQPQPEIMQGFKPIE